MNLFDAFCTMMWIEIGWAIEANPIMSQALDMGVSEFILAKIFLVLLSVFLLWKLRDHTLSRVLVIPVIFLYTYVSLVHIVMILKLIFKGPGILT